MWRQRRGQNANGKAAGPVSGRDVDEGQGGGHNQCLRGARGADGRSSLAVVRGLAEGLDELHKGVLLDLELVHAGISLVVSLCVARKR